MYYQDKIKIQWLKDQLSQVDLRPNSCDNFTVYLFREAAFAYCADLPVASILCITAAWNSLLRVKLKKYPKGKRGLIDGTTAMVNEAYENGFINRSLHSRLLQFQRGIRNPIEHSKTDHPYKGVSEWHPFLEPTLKGVSISWREFSESGINVIDLFPETSSAKRGIKLFLELYQSLMEID